MATSKRLIRLLSIAFVVAASVMYVGAPAISSQFVMDDSTDLCGYAGTIHLYALVTRDADVYNYSYTLTYGGAGPEGAPAPHAFGVGNDNWAEYFNAWSSNAFNADGTEVLGTAFDLPSYNPDSDIPDIEWTGDAARQFELGQTRKFGYQSYFAPMTDMKVYAWLINGGVGADGETIGMASTIPEPAGILALGLGLAGVAPLFRRRK